MINFQFMMEPSPKTYDLEERTAVLSERIIELCKSIPSAVVSRPIVGQLVRSGTSVGANYCEANNASSKKDFRNKIFICKKEAQETKYWFRMLEKYSPEKQSEIKVLWQEMHELVLIFQKSINSSRENDERDLFF